MNEEINMFEKYSNIRRQIDSLTIEKKNMEDEILVEISERLKGSKEKTLKTEFGNFTKKVSTSYSFSTDIVELSVENEKKIKAYVDPLKKEIEVAKQKEIDEKIAVPITSETLAFAYKKNDK